jgi:RNA 2',3'-cyclic 3'-phosphodiesterase
VPERASVQGRERPRLFVALVLPESVVERLVAWQEDVFPPAPGVRFVPRENLHITLAFLGHRPVDEVAPILDEVRVAAGGAHELELELQKYRETPRVGMLVLDDATPKRHSRSLAHGVQKRMEKLGIPLRERRPWTPHVTVLRFSGDRPRFDPALPDLGPVSPSEVALYHSVLRPSGAQYEILESVALGG